MRVHVAYVAPQTEALVALDVPADATVEVAVAQSGIIERLGLSPTVIAYAIYGRRVQSTARLVDGDRIEITRPLACDPTLARRRRASAKG
jgi:putative ubiquitin-RnfH superfamily antitoxin RatB of RatAB toxin-antitoxin module